MNKVLEAIFNRRTIRSFTEEPVGEKELKEIVDAGLAAPSAMNYQPWHFTVIQTQKIIDGLSEATKEILKNSSDPTYREFGENEEFHIFYRAPVVIIVAGEEKDSFAETGCAAATENMFLAAESLGLGAAWIGLVSILFQGETLEKYACELSVPKGYRPLYALAIGHKREADAPPERKPNKVSYL